MGLSITVNTVKIPEVVRKEINNEVRKTPVAAAAVNERRTGCVVYGTQAFSEVHMQPCGNVRIAAVLRRASARCQSLAAAQLKAAAAVWVGDAAKRGRLTRAPS